MGKGTAYDDSVRVPMYARWPGHFTAGATDNRMVANLDLAPTIADAVGGIAPGGPDGRPLHARPASEPHAHADRVRGQQTDFEPGWAALRTLTSHYIEHYADADRQRIVHREYYDLFADPFELDNLLGDASAANDPNTAVLSAQLAADRRVRRSGLPVGGRTPNCRRPTPIWLSWPAMSTHQGRKLARATAGCRRPGARRLRR